MMIELVNLVILKFIKVKVVIIYSIYFYYFENNGVIRYLGDKNLGINFVIKLFNFKFYR